MNQDLKDKSSVLDEIERKYSRTFRNRDLIAKILSIANNKKESYEELIFTGKYLNGLFKAVSKQDYSNTGILQNEIVKSIEKIKSLLSYLLGEEFSGYEEAYFKAEKESFLNLNTLVSDLDLLKIYTNDLKNKS